MSNRLQLQLAAVVRSMHEPAEWETEADRAAQTWAKLREEMGQDMLTGGEKQIPFASLAGHLHLQSVHLSEKTRVEVESILYDEITSVQELASWEEPLVESGCYAPEDMAHAKTEDELHEECWDALHEACGAGGQISSVGRFGADRISGLPILDPPTVLSRNQLIREDQPYYIVAGFARQAFFVKRQIGLNASTSFTAEELLRMGKAQFTKTVSAFEHAMPGSAQEKIHQRSDLEAMVGQLEQSSLEEDGKALVEVLQQVQAVETSLREEMSRSIRAAKEVVDEAVSAMDTSGEGSRLRAFVCADNAAEGRDAEVRFGVDAAAVDEAVSAMNTSGEGSRLRAFVCADNAADRRDAKFLFGVDAAAAAVGGGTARSLRRLLQELQERTERVKAGGECPCHFSTLTTATYHWEDLADILRKYEEAVRQFRGGRMDPLEPSERRLTEVRRRVLRYPGVVAWFTAYKMELFYKFVLQYEDGHAVFEWGAGGIMHLHSINWGSQMPRINPEKLAAAECSDWSSLSQGATFARAHEEYFTDWSWTKKEKWVFQEVDNKKAAVATAGSPVHTDSESSGSDDETGGAAAVFPVDIVPEGDVFQQHALAEDEDFVRLFPTVTSMQYAVTADGARQRVRLSREQLRTFEALSAKCADESRHPCQITIPQKALLMTNNCRVVRRVRRKWYRRLTQKCNMHDRHSGVPTETPPVFVDVVAPVCADGATMEDVVERTAEATVVRAGTLNLKQLDLAHQIGEILEKLNLDVMCLQEMSAACLGDLLQVSEQRGYDVISPLHRQVTALEGFDVCILLKRSTVRKLRVSVMGLGAESARRLLQVQLQLRGNGAILVLGTCHLKG
eukprot:s590_g13.t1